MDIDIGIDIIVYIYIHSLVGIDGIDIKRYDENWAAADAGKRPFYARLSQQVAGR
jgi:hypothetical protein